MPLPLVLKFWGRADTLSPREKPDGSCLDKNLGLGSQSWFIMEHSISCSVKSAPEGGGVGGGRRELRGMEPAKPDAENGQYLKLAYFYDPFVNLSWSLIKMSEFPTFENKLHVPFQK